MEQILAWIIANPQLDIQVAKAAVEILQATAPIIEKDFANGNVRTGIDAILQNAKSVNALYAGPASQNAGISGQ